MSDNNIFGDTIVLLRKEKGLTQKELADKLGVTDKAVSRWETGKNYPDIEVLKKLADVLEVSVDDLLQGDIRLVEKKSSKKKKIIAAIIIALLVYYFPIYHLIPVCNTYFYGAREASFLMFRGFVCQQLQVRDVMKLADEAFSDVGISVEEAEEKYGALSIYCLTDDYSEVVDEKHKLRLWSVRTFNVYTVGSPGYMWVYYSQDGFDKDGNSVTGASQIPALWYLEKDKNGNWYVADIKEGP